MSKYDPLWQYICAVQPTSLSFREVEEICGFPIDHSFLSFKKELDAYGFKIGKISMKEKTVVVEKI